MRNKKERMEFVENEKNWHVIDSMQFAVLKRLTYKGESWLKIQHLIERERFDHKERTRKIRAQFEDKGLYIVSESGNAVCWTTKTEIVDRMGALDKAEKEGKKKNND